MRTDQKSGAKGTGDDEVGLLKEELDAVYALLLQTTGEALVIPALNRDGDTLSDLVLQMFGSIAGAESLVLDGRHRRQCHHNRFHR